MLSFGTAYVISEWMLRIAMLVYVPQRRSPASARAWLLLIFFLPWLGFALYALIGRAYVPRRRLEMQARLAELMASMPERFQWMAPTLPPVMPHLAEGARLARNLGSFDVCGGNMVELARTRAAENAFNRGADLVGTVDVLHAVSGIYGSYFDHVLYERGATLEELSERLAGAPEERSAAKHS